MHNKIRPFVPLAAMALAILVGGCSTTSVIFRDANVTVSETRPVWFNVHGRTVKTLTVHNVAYDGVRGMKPYYLNMPGGTSILFVTEQPNETVTFHVVNLGTGSPISIDGHKSGFGGNIGSGRRAGEPFTNYIEKTDKGVLLLVQRAQNWESEARLNTSSWRIESEKTTYFDGAGNEMRQTTQTFE